MDKMLILRQAVATLLTMNEGKINLFGKLDINPGGLERLWKASEALGVTPKLPALYSAILLGNSHDNLKRELPYLRLPKSISAAILQKHMDFTAFAAKALWIDGKDTDQHLLMALVIGAIAEKEAKSLQIIFSKAAPKFPVDGNDLFSIGLRGKDIGIHLARSKKIWIESGFTLSKEELL
jgi:hypothetical protein